MGDAGLARFIDRFTVEYIRTYAHPIDRVWRAVTDPAEFGVWFIPGALEPRPGGAYWFGSEDGDFKGRIAEVDPPRRIRFGDTTGYFQYELTEIDGGTRLRFVQHFGPNGTYAETPNDLGGDLPGGPDTPWKPGFVGGWHEFFDALGDFLDAVPIGSRLPETEMGALAAKWMDEQVALGEFAADKVAGYAFSLRRHERWNELNKVYREHIRTTLPKA